MVAEKIESRKSEKVDDRQYKIDKLFIKFTADQAIMQKKDVTHLKYHVQYTPKKDFEGHFDPKKQSTELFTHEVKGTIQERIQILEEINQRSCSLALKKKKTLVGKNVLGKSDQQMASLSRTSPFTEKIEFYDCGAITVEVRLECSIVTEEEMRPRQGSIFAKAANTVTFGKLGADQKEAERAKSAQIQAKIEVKEIAAAKLRQEAEQEKAEELAE